MIAALILGTYAFVVALYAPIVLHRRWPADRTPRLTVTVLHILSCSFLIAATTAGLALGLTLIDRLTTLSPSIDACSDQLPINDESAVGPLIGDLGLAAAVTLAIRIVYSLLVTFGAARRRRRHHAKALRVLATPDHEQGFLILDHAEPACYCLPGRPGTVVISSGALNRLSPPQLRAVLAHERAHLRSRHHLVIALAVAVRRAVPGVRLLAYTERETRRLVELIADDAAARQSGAATVASALAVIGLGHVPGAALGMGSRDLPPAVARVTRLVLSERRLRRRTRVLSLVIAIATAAVPVLLAVVSAMAVVRHCPRDHDDGLPQSGRPVSVAQHGPR
ncbi:M56 family metallopeptidase [Catenulispora subtropica]|uniref:M56 family metallopeptidase n=1 Tax=Catenulispora subtropica TaxID=450798 RepID=A0ABN2SH86_9ACTN